MAGSALSKANGILRIGEGTLVDRIFGLKGFYKEVRVEKMVGWHKCYWILMMKGKGGGKLGKYFDWQVESRLTWMGERWA